MRKLFTIFTLLLLTVGFAFGQEKCVQLKLRYIGGEHSIILDWSDGTLQWSAYHDNKEVVAPSRLAMVTDRGVWGENITQASIQHTDYIYYSCTVVDFGDYSVELRAYHKGVAYRFISNIDGDYKIIDELAEFSFNKRDKAWVPYVNYRPDATSDYATQFETSFENTYTYTALKDID